jgi:hypothetical protein
LHGSTGGPLIVTVYDGAHIAGATRPVGERSDH